MNSLQRYDDVPTPLKWFLISIKEVGFPIAVCIWLTWFTTVTMKNQTEAVNKLSNAMDKNTAFLRMLAHKLHMKDLDE